jgi:hypothetical protein
MNANPPSTLVAIEASAWWTQDAWRSAPSRADLRVQLPATIEVPELAPAAPRSLLVVRARGAKEGAELEVLPLRGAARVGMVRLRNLGDHVELELRADEGMLYRSPRPLGTLQPGSALRFGVNGRHPARMSGGRWRYVDEEVLVAWPNEVHHPLDVQLLMHKCKVRTIDLREILP